MEPSSKFISLGTRCPIRAILMGGKKCIAWTTWSWCIIVGCLCIWTYLKSYHVVNILHELDIHKLWHQYKWIFSIFIGQPLLHGWGDVHDASH
jgi:hypothetical protein